MSRNRRRYETWRCRTAELLLKIWTIRLPKSKLHMHIFWISICQQNCLFCKLIQWITCFASKRTMRLVWTVSLSRLTLKLAYRCHIRCASRHVHWQWRRTSPITKRPSFKYFWCINKLDVIVVIALIEWIKIGRVVRFHLCLHQHRHWASFCTSRRHGCLLCYCTIHFRATKHTLSETGDRLDRIFWTFLLLKHKYAELVTKNTNIHLLSNQVFTMWTWYFHVV